MNISIKRSTDSVEFAMEDFHRELLGNFDLQPCKTHKK
jgi:hypothetical protein